MTDLEIFETLCPHVAPLSVRDRATLRSDLFGNEMSSTPGRTSNRDDVRRDRTTTGRTRRRPRARIAAAIAVPVVAVAGVAAAGLIPSGVLDRFGGLEERSGGDMIVSADDAAIVAQAEAAGYRLELWTAPVDSGEVCVYLRYMWNLDSDVPGENGPVMCDFGFPVAADPAIDASDGSDLVGLLSVFPLGEPSISGGVSPGPMATGIAGAVDPRVRSLVVELSDGHEIDVDVTDAHGWITQIIDADLMQSDAYGVWANTPTSLTLLGDGGTELATLDTWASLINSAIYEP